MAKRTRIWVSFGLAVLALLSFAGCSGEGPPQLVVRFATQL